MIFVGFIFLILVWNPNRNLQNKKLFTNKARTIMGVFLVNLSKQTLLIQRKNNMKNKIGILFIALVLVLAIAGCASAADSSVDSAQPATETTSEVVVESEFPMLPDALNITALEGSVLYQSATTLADAQTFYQTEFTSLELTQDKTLTLQDETMFKLVFTGSKNGLSLIVEAKKLNDSSISISIQYE
jgi:hypothetical protein